VGGQSMRHLAGAVLLLLLAWPAAWADDKPKDEPTPKAKLAELRKEYQKAQQAFFSAIGGAKTPEEQSKKMADASPAFEKVLAKFVELAEKHPKDDAAIEALQQVLSNQFVQSGPKGARARAVELLLKDHVASDKLGPLCQVLGGGLDKKNEALLRAVLDKNTHKPVQAEAVLALAQNLQQRAEVAKAIAANPDLAKRIDAMLDKESAEAVKKADPAKLLADAQVMYKRMADKHLGDFKADRLVNLCQRLGRSSDEGSEALLRTLMDKHDKDEVKGNACLALAQAMKQRADALSEKDAKAADKARKQAEELFTQAAAKYANVKAGFRGTVGEKAKGELYELKHLAIGKAAPEVEGEDQDGKTFKLADYKGKVVLLDFWNEF
jgi:hypothetical protein